MTPGVAGLVVVFGVAIGVTSVLNTNRIALTQNSYQSGMGGTPCSHSITGLGVRTTMIASGAMSLQFSRSDAGGQVGVTLGLNVGVGVSVRVAVWLGVEVGVAVG